MSTVAHSPAIVGTLWSRNSYGGRLCVIKDRAMSHSGKMVIELLYGPDFEPSIPPATILETDFLADCERQPRPEFYAVSGEDVTYVYVKGWPKVTEAMRYYASDEIGLCKMSEPVVYRRTYLAFLQTSLARAEGWRCEIRSYKTPGRGRFKATAFMTPERRFDVDMAEVEI